MVPFGSGPGDGPASWGHGASGETAWVHGIVASFPLYTAVSPRTHTVKALGFVTFLHEWNYMFDVEEHYEVLLIMEYFIY